MDDETRGFVEGVIDDMVKDDFRKHVEWIRQEIPVSSLRDLMIGFRLGATQAAAEFICFSIKKRQSKQQQDEDDREVRSILKRRLPEISERVAIELNM